MIQHSSGGRKKKEKKRVVLMEEIILKKQCYVIFQTLMHMLMLTFSWSRYFKMTNMIRPSLAW